MFLRVVSVVGLLVMIAALAVLIARHALIGESPLPIGIQILSLLLMAWARVTFGRRSFHAAANPTEGGLVTSGPYRYIRHPIYAAAMYFTWAGVFSHLSAMNAVLGMCEVAGAGLRIIAEERLVSALYPEYAAYAIRTKRIIPYLL